MNTTFLAKQGCKVLTQSDNIWVRTVKPKHLNDDLEISSVPRRVSLLQQGGTVSQAKGF